MIEQAADAGRPGAASPDGTAPQTILERVALGDRAAVRACIDRHGGLVWSLARRACRDGAEAEDLVQEVFIALWESAPRFDPRVASETTFVAMIARRRLIDRRRRLRSRPDTQPLPDGLVAPDRPEAAVDRADDVDRAARALEQLRDEQRRVLTLSLRDGLSYDQIARATGWPLGTVKTHARRGLIRLRELLDARPRGIDP